MERSAWVWRGVAVAAAALALGGAGAQAPPSRFPAPEHEPGALLVRFNLSTSARERLEVAGALGAVAERTLLDSRYVLLRVPARANVASLASVAVRLPGVEDAQPNYLYRGLWAPNDPFFDVQWALAKIQWSVGMDIYRGRTEIRVAVIDSGVNNTHADLIAQLLTGFNTITGTTNTWDDNGHGTHVTGILGAATDNGIGIAGVCPTLRIVPVKALNASLVGASADVKEAIDWAVQNGCHVINMSFGGTTDDAAVRQSVQNAAAAGCVLVGAAGNSAASFPIYPAAYESVIDVGGTDPNDNRYVLSNYNFGADQYVDVAAPAVNILSTSSGGGFGLDSGTSMAAPHVAGLAALLYGAVTRDEPIPARSVSKARQVREYIEQNTDPIGDWIRFGRINLYKPLRRAFGATVRGRVDLNGHLHPENVWVYAVLMTGSTVVEAQPYYPKADGTFDLIFTHGGRYDIRFLTPANPYLARRARDVDLVVGAAVEGIEAHLPGGDVLRDGVVDLRDVAQLLVHFQEASPSLDVNGSGAVDIADINIALLAFGATAES